MSGIRQTPDFRKRSRLNLMLLAYYFHKMLSPYILFFSNYCVDFEKVTIGRMTLLYLQLVNERRNVLERFHQLITGNILKEQKPNQLFAFYILFVRAYENLPKVIVVILCLKQSSTSVTSWFAKWS